MRKDIFGRGGVVSSVGKGITPAAIGRILKSRGLSVSIQKLDPYLNIDPGTMSPYQHGEVFVTGDGSGTALSPAHTPHVTNEIKGCIRAVGRETGGDVVIVEVGGTVGDIEGQPFLEAIRQMRKE